MGTRTSPSLLVVLVLLLAAAPPSQGADGRQEEAVQELLLFWEEKDLYVESATRSPLPLSRVAENVSVVTAKDIEALHAHTLAEVLERVTGVFVNYAGHDFLSGSSVMLQGSNERHALVLVDGVPLNGLADNKAETLALPVSIIDRIEVVKGPASSAWGSSLGGVVNIITKAAGSSAAPEGTASASYGERNSQEYSAELRGAAGPLGYFIHAGRRESDGLALGRWSRAQSAYGKLSLPLWSGASLGFTAGYGEVEMKAFDAPELQLSGEGLTRPFFRTLSLETGLAPGLRMTVSAYTLQHNVGATMEDTGSGAVLVDRALEDRSRGGAGKVVWTAGPHTLVAGAEYGWGEAEQNLVPQQPDPRVEKWAVFVNDSVALGRFTVTPGVRYDRNSISGSFTSPSLGATLQAGEYTVVRASVARGFTYPPLAYTSLGDGVYLVPNRDLEPEKVWSYQAGAETDVAGRVWVKATVFHHRQTGALEKVLDSGPEPPYEDRMENVGEIRTTGVEAEAETARIYNLSLKAGGTYVHVDPVPDVAGKYSLNLALCYDDRSTWRALLSGVYATWVGENVRTGRWNGMVWDVSVDRRVSLGAPLALDVFLAAHNLFNASAYTDEIYPNPRRWVEGGVRLHF